MVARGEGSRVWEGHGGGGGIGQRMQRANTRQLRLEEAALPSSRKLPTSKATTFWHFPHRGSHMSFWGCHVWLLHPEAGSALHEEESDYLLTKCNLGKTKPQPRLWRGRPVKICTILLLSSTIFIHSARLTSDWAVTPPASTSRVLLVEMRQRPEKAQSSSSWMLTSKGKLTSSLVISLIYVF